CAAPLRLRLWSRAALLLMLLCRRLPLLHLLRRLRRGLPLRALLVPLLRCAAPLRLRLWSRAAFLLMLLRRWLRLLRLLRRLRGRLPLRTLVLRWLLCRRLLPLALLLLRLAWCLPGRRRGAARHARRIVAEAPALAGG